MFYAALFCLVFLLFSIITEANLIMSTSRTELTVNGLELSVYGLTEYKKLNEGSPAAVMFAMHGRTNNKTQMEAVSQVLCSLNGNKGGQQLQRYLLVVTFDHLNHGSRLVDKNRNLGWTKGKNNNPTHAIDQWSMISAAAHTVTSLIDVLEYYLFGPHQHPVEVWGCIGFSMGAHASYITAAHDPRISVQISLVGAADFIGLLQDRLKEGGFPAEYLPERFCAMVRLHYEGLGARLMSKKVLLINGGNDTLVPARYNDDLVNILKNGEGASSEYNTWARIVVPGVGHAWSPEMFDLASRWCRQWMILSPSPSDAQFSLPH